MKISRLLFLTIPILLITGCASPIKVGDFTRSTNIDYPPKSTHVTKGLGERLVAQGSRTVGPAIVVTETTQFNKEEGESSVMTCAVTVTPTSVFKRGTYQTDSVQADCFGPVNYQITLSNGTTNWNCQGQTGVGDICHNGKGEFFLAALAATAPLEQDHDHIRLVEKAVENKDNFIQELIYNGRVGNSLKFVYREFSDDLIRPAFSQEVQYDLSESSIVGFKDLRIKIIDASNTEITYILISNFNSKGL